MTEFCRCFLNHSVIQPLDALHQRQTLQLMLQAAQQADDNFASTQRIAWEGMVHMWVDQKLLKSNKIRSFLNDQLQVLNATFEET